MNKPFHPLTCEHVSPKLQDDPQNAYKKKRQFAIRSSRWKNLWILMSNQKPVLNISNCHLHWMHVGPGEGGWQVGLVMLRMHVTIQNLAKIRNLGCPCTHSGGMARKKLEFWHYGSRISYSHRMSQKLSSKNSPRKCLVADWKFRT